LVLKKGGEKFLLSLKFLENKKIKEKSKFKVFIRKKLEGALNN